MPDKSSLNIELLRAAYAAFNARNIDAALAIMTNDVAWPKAFKGGFVHGPQEVRDYWTEQWSEINPHVEPASFHSEDDGRILVDVHFCRARLGWNCSCLGTRWSSFHHRAWFNSKHGSLSTSIRKLQRLTTRCSERRKAQSAGCSALRKKGTRRARLAASRSLGSVRLLEVVG